MIKDQPGAGRSVLVDARSLRSSGIGRYLREVLTRLFDDPRFGAVTLLGDPDELRVFLRERGVAGQVRVEPYPFGFYSPGAQLAWAARWRRVAARTDVSFFPHYDAPFFGLPRRSVVTVHDLAHFKLAEFPLRKRLPAGLLFDRVTSRAGRVLVVSETTRRDLVKRLPAVGPRTEVVPNGVSDFFRPAAPGEEGERAPVEGAFLLCVGNRKPHKNFRAAVEALALLRAHRPELRLVVVGRVFDATDAVAERAAELGVRDALVELDGVEDRELRALYRSCEAFLFPSLHEGFGIPVLEAMACGAPVVASDGSSIPEVAGDAALLVDPLDARAMAGAVRRLHGDPAFREEMVTRGHARASSFSWERSAAQTLDALYAVASGARRPGPQESPKA